MTPDQVAKFFPGQAAGAPSPRRTTGAPDLAALLALHGLPRPVPEFRFAPPRRWRFDWAYPRIKLALEFEGGTFTAGRHTRGRGFEGDCRKYNAAAAGGWAVLRFTRRMVDSGEAVAVVREALRTRPSVE